MDVKLVKNEILSKNLLSYNNFDIVYNFACIWWNFALLWFFILFNFLDLKFHWNMIRINILLHFFSKTMTFDECRCIDISMLGCN